MRIGDLDYGQILLNLNQNQSQLTNLSEQLSSGLRINSAADDPSGLAIADNLQSESAGLQQGISNVQTANNALTVADGAMTAVTNILQRMRSLVVEANSDLNSSDNLAQIQAEIDELADEINEISNNTNFNGLKLLDGSLASTAYQPAQLLYVQNPQVDGGTQNLIDPSYDTGTGFGTNLSPTAEQLNFSFSVDSYDATTNLLQVTVTASSPDPAFGPAQVTVLHVTPGSVPQGQNYFQEFGPGSEPYTITDQAGNPVFQFTFNGLSASDVGKEAIVASTPTVYPTNGHPLEVNTGTGEGSVIPISIGPVNSAALGVNEIVVGDTLMNQGSEARIDNALQTILSQQAQVGAQEISLNEAANDASIQWLNETASESSIRDLNVGQATTEYTRQQLLVDVGTNVLTQMEVSAKQVTALLISALVG
jgi:flagellin